MTQRTLVVQVPHERRKGLKDKLGQHPHVGDIRGRGMFRGVEIVADRESKAPFDPKLGIAGKIKKAAQNAGLIIYPANGTVDGQNGDHVLIAPPFIISEDEIGILVDRTAGAIDEVLAKVA